MFKRYGCGCVYLITQVDADNDNYPTHGRLIDYCGGDDLTFGHEVRIEDRINPENIKIAVSLTPKESEELFTRMNNMIHKGYQFIALTQTLRSVING